MSLKPPAQNNLRNKVRAQLYVSSYNIYTHRYPLVDRLRKAMHLALKGLTDNHTPESTRLLRCAIYLHANAFGVRPGLQAPTHLTKWLHFRGGIFPPPYPHDIAEARLHNFNEFFKWQTPPTQS